MKTINLTKGQVAFVDDADFDLLSQHRWQALKGKHTYYAVRKQRIGKRSIGKQLSILMHRFLLKAPKGMEGDHIDGNGLNNQKSNLRISTISQNRGNRIRNQSGKTSQFKGVSISCKGKWVSNIQINKKYMHLGTFKNEIEAAKAYDMAAIQHFKEFASPNFPS